jgi:tRNA 2-selenouridine synthase
MPHPLTIQNFFELSGSLPIVDVRTPAEYAHGHLPGACNLPLFSNEERAQVGTTYKQVGREAAVLLGFDLTGPKWSGFIKQALKIAPDKKIVVHCWRGGMRSGAMAWALGFYGFEVYIIEGGYKSYRRWTQELFAAPYNLMILGGMTGSGKTNILHELRLLGEQVVDLEGLAQHQGSSYGTMNRMVQPTQEQFENNFVMQLSTVDPQRKIWVEDESLTIGKCMIPSGFWKQMYGATLININVGLEQRVEALVAEYGVLDKDFLVTCTERIGKRLGTEHTKHAVAAIREGRMDDFIRLVLVYYDKAYRTGLTKRSTQQVFTLDLEGTNAPDNAQEILTFIQTVPAAEKA